MWWDIATADANELTEYRRLCCRHCWGFGFNYQWCDAVEYDDAVKKAMLANKARGWLRAPVRKHDSQVCIG